MRIVLIGAVAFSRRALERLIEIRADMVGVCTLSESRFNADHSDLGDICEARGISWVYAEDINSEESIRWIADKRPDVIFCFGWSRLLGERLLHIAPLGVIGFHPAALPANRGRHPIIWALVLGLKETASTFFFMDEDADRGDILSQQRIEIEDRDNASTLYEKITLYALDQIAVFVPQLTSGSFPRVPQDDRCANTWRKRSKADGQIDWRMSARSIHNLVRGLTKPYVGAHFLYQGQVYKVWSTEVVTGVPQNIEPGKILETADGRPVVRCGEQGIRLLKTEPPIDPAPGEYL